VVQQNPATHDDPLPWDLIQRTLARLIRHAGFSSQERDDLAQELALHVLKRSSAFDPGRASQRAFLATILDRFAKNLVRERWAAKRDPRRVGSLQAPIATDDGEAERITLLDEHAVAAQRLTSPRSPQERAELASDVAHILSQLPPRLRDLAERLCHRSLAEVARDLGTPRTTLADSVRHLRKRFEAAGLRHYLEEAPSTRRASG